MQGDDDTVREAGGEAVICNGSGPTCSGSVQKILPGAENAVAKTDQGESRREKVRTKAVGLVTQLASLCQEMPCSQLLGIQVMENMVWTQGKDLI